MRRQEQAQLTFLEKMIIFVSIISEIVFFGMTFYITEYYTSIIYNVFLTFFFILGIVGIIALVLFNWCLKSDHVIDFYKTSYERVNHHF